ncbi:hypothetical protein QAD02_020472 [Eretmocerus hayati]|uniref:Uncharacterized protein n=1 Tax=Eretmocerus hayati TaxID=131215 RepID=A0ACC2PQ02_9HYME|nr:hypothetical protein QAD02_020472 [Eretmocerus hayati]
MMKFVGALCKGDDVVIILPTMVVREKLRSDPIAPKNATDFKTFWTYKIIRYLCESLAPEESYQRCADVTCKHARGYYSAIIKALGETREGVERKLAQMRIAPVPEKLKSASGIELLDEMSGIKALDENDQNDYKLTKSISTNGKLENPDESPLDELKRTAGDSSEQYSIKRLKEIKKEKGARMSSTSVKRAQQQITISEEKNSPHKFPKNNSPSPRATRKYRKPSQLVSENLSDTLVPNEKRRNRAKQFGRGVLPGGYSSRELRLSLSEKDSQIQNQDQQIAGLEKQLTARSQSKNSEDNIIQDHSVVGDVQENNTPTIGHNQDTSLASNPSVLRPQNEESSLPTRALIERYTRGYQEIQEGQSRPRKRTWVIVADADLYYRTSSGGGYAELSKRYKVFDGDVFLSESVRADPAEWRVMNGLLSIEDEILMLSLIIWNDDLANRTIQPENVNPKDYIDVRGPVLQLEYEKLRLLISILDDLMTSLRPDKEDRVKDPERTCILQKVPTAVTAHARSLCREIRRRLKKKKNTPQPTTSDVDSDNCNA